MIVTWDYLIHFHSFEIYDPKSREERFKKVHFFWREVSRCYTYLVVDFGEMKVFGLNLNNPKSHTKCEKQNYII